MKLLRIAQIAPIVERVPPKEYGGTERVVYNLTEELVKRGHDVTLFATGDSIISARLSYVYPMSLREAKISDNKIFNKWRLIHLEEAYKMQDKFDIIHDHNDYPHGIIRRTPTVLTMHGLLRKSRIRSFKNLYPVAISHSQKKSAPAFKTVTTVYNGLLMDDYPFSDTPGSYLLFVGRISRKKGVEHAIKVALALNLKLIIAAKVDKKDREYFQKHIRPLLLAHSNIEWIGEVNEDQRNNLMRNALCLLSPVMWNEPFGLTMIEAMACGCPVVAFNKGSIPEVVKNGRTGFVVENVDEMKDAVLKINKIDRIECRKHALANFSVEKMTNEYEALYYKILKKHSLIFPARAHIYPLLTKDYI